jgi:hypothetical protein
MDPAQLKRWLDAGLSLEQIGVLTNRDASTVGYWVRKHGLRANGQQKYSPRGGLAREELEPLVESGLTLREMADHLSRSISTVRYWLGRHGLKTKRRHANRDKARAAREAGENRFIGQCRHHDETVFLVFSDGSSKCARCNSEHVSNRRRRKKEALVREFGGRCMICGYDRYIGALQFHHVDPESKTFGIAQKGVTISLDRSREEAIKCALLCANCHAEVEGGAASL